MKLFRSISLADSFTIAIFIVKARKSVATTSTSTSTTISTPVIVKKEPDLEEIKKDEEETSEGSTVAEEELNMCEDLFTVVMTANAEDGHPLHTPFQLLPSKKVSDFFLIEIC